MKKILIVCDTETNGFKVDDSVLSICMIKLEVDTEALTMQRIAYYEKYYHLKDCEPANMHAIGVNGLTAKVIDEMREATRIDFGDYPRLFHDDDEALNAFTEGCDMFITHNTAFDLKYFRTQPNNVWCSMKNASTECRTACGKALGKKPKDPKLNELAEYLGVKIDENNLHGAKYDTIVLEKCLKKLLIGQDKSFMEALNR